MPGIGCRKENKMFSSLFKRKPKLPEVSLDTYANYPIFLMLEGKPPFTDWKDPKSSIEPDLEEFFRMSVWMYQMYTYYILTAKRFGYEIADKVVGLQAERLSRASQELGRQLCLGIQQIHGIVSRKMEDPDLRVEYATALEFLTLSEESPFHTTRTEFDQKGVPDYREQDFALAACLEHGKTAALNEFLTFTQESKVSL
jgi:hypothetical protein